MSRRPLTALVLGALVALAACGPGGGGTASAPAASPSGTLTSNASPTVSASSRGSASPGASACRQSGDSGVVAVSIADFEFKPASIGASVGQVVAFSNIGFEPHNATVEAGCATRTLQTGESDGLVFNVTGRYTFGCTVHPWMTATFTITR